MDYICTKLSHMEFFSMAGDIPNSRLRVVELGHSKPAPGRRVKMLTDSWHLHFLIAGDGKFNSVPVRSGQGFVVRQNEYFSEEVGADGLEQYWINFTGDEAENLLSGCGVEEIFSFEKNFSRAHERLFSAFDDPKSDRFSMLGLLFTLCGLIRGQGQANSARTGAELHIRTAEEFVRRSYAGELSVKMIADECRVSPKYLSRIYREIRGTTLVSFITNTRLEAARRLLERSDSAGGGSVSQIAFAVGYSDPLYFSTAFRRRFGVPPGEWRKNARGTY